MNPALNVCIGNFSSFGDLKALEATLSNYFSIHVTLFEDCMNFWPTPSFKQWRIHYMVHGSSHAAFAIEEIKSCIASTTSDRMISVILDPEGRQIPVSNKCSSSLFPK